MTNKESYEYLTSEKHIQQHDYFRRLENITQIISQNVSIRDVGSLYTPIKPDFQNQIKEFEKKIKTLPVSKKGPNENTNSFISRYLESRNLQNLHSNISHDAFRIDKAIEGGYFTKNNRKKHSIEVAKIAKQLGRKLKLDEKDIITAELASLCHDLGHSPFGHSGQRAIANKLKSLGLNEYLSDDNLQALDKANEMGVSDKVIETLIYHDGKPIKDVEHKYNKENLPEYFHKFINDRNKVPPIVAQVAAISDDIANDSRDIMDIYKTKGANSCGKTLQELSNRSVLFSRAYSNVLKNNPCLTESKIAEKTVDELRKEYISDVVAEFTKRSSKEGESENMVVFSESMDKEHDNLRTVIREMFKEKTFRRFDQFVQRTMSKVFDAFYYNNPNIKDAVNLIDDEKIKKNALSTVEKLNKLDSGSHNANELRAKEVIKFIYNHLDDKSCYELSKNIGQFGRIEKGYNYQQR